MATWKLFPTDVGYRTRSCASLREYVHTYRCTLLSVKRRDLEKRLAECGWRFLRSGGRHDVWTDGQREETVPRQREINERLARLILRRACKERI